MVVRVALAAALGAVVGVYFAALVLWAAARAWLRSALRSANCEICEGPCQMRHSASGPCSVCGGPCSFLN